MLTGDITGYCFIYVLIYSTIFEYIFNYTKTFSIHNLSTYDLYTFNSICITITKYDVMETTT